MAIDPEVKALIEELRATIARLEKRVSELEAENAELRSRLGQDSSNSSKPPSSDSPFKRKPPKQAGTRKVGGQPGHKGVTRDVVPPEKVSERRAIRPGRCLCGHDLTGVAPEGAPQTRQVIDIPPIEPHVTEFLFHAVRCPSCRRLNEPEVPAEAQTGTGPQLTALAAMLVGQYRLSREAVADLLARILDLPICGATVQACCERLGDALAAPVAELEKALPATKGVHMDETSWKERKALRWLWVAVAKGFSCFAIHARRGADQLRAWFPKGYAGGVHSDRWRPYEFFPVEQRQLCWSHLLRDFQAIVDRRGAGAAGAARMLVVAEALFVTWWQFKDGKIDRQRLQDATASFRGQIRRFCKEGKRQKEDRKWHSLGCDLLRQWPAVFRFIDVEGYEPTNNAAERALRTAVLWRRSSQGTRTETGSAFVGRILSVVATCRQQERDILGYLADALLAYRRGLSPPSLLPT